MKKNLEESESQEDLVSQKLQTAYIGILMAYLSAYAPASPNEATICKSSEDIMQELDCIIALAQWKVALVMSEQGYTCGYLEGQFGWLMKPA